MLLGFAAVNTGNNLLYLIVAALLGFMAITGVVGKGNLEGVRIAVDPPEEVYAGEPTQLRVTLQNRRRRWPAFLLRVELDGFQALLPGLACNGSDSVSLAACFPTRGRRRLATIRLSSAFPVAFFRRARDLRLDRELLVFPRPLPLPLPPAGSGTLPRGSRRNSVRRGHGGEVARIADYTGSEPLKRIHWKLSARQDELKVKEAEEAASEPIVIDLDQLPGGELEIRLGQAAWLIGRYLRAGRAVGLRCANVVHPPALGREQKLRLLRVLALYGHD